MFNGVRFFNLLRKWKNEEKYNYIKILRCIMLYYFDLTAGFIKSSTPLKIKGGFGTNEISYVLDAVGYHWYSINTSNPGEAIVTLRNSL